ncbi:Hydroxyacylglutathione hydrolase GloC [Candidatus Calditenuaceae archaeon HR02]|nr:Hydroxyacylglutathione hydrolase GloC [Candidatus Calditenuaceae archaeon HR02]
MEKVYYVSVGPLRSNSYLLIDGGSGEAVIIDAGDEPHKILGLLKTGVKVKKIIATHGHFDHVLAVDDIREVLGVEFLIHRADQVVLDILPEATLRILGIRLKPPRPDGYLEDGDIIHVGGLQLRIIHTPGHSPGSSCLLTGKTLFSGDTLFQGTIGRTDIPLADPQKIVESIKSKLYTLPDDILVYPGHGPSTTVGYEKRNNPFVRA